MSALRALSAGHSYRHGEKCQADYDPTRVKGNGLSSGEEIEANWAKMMHLWPRIRELSSSNRHDELTEHLHHIASVCRDSLGKTLRRQYLRASRTLAQHTNLVHLFRQNSGLTDDEVARWYRQYRLQRDRQQKDLEIDLLEQKRQTLIEAHEDVLYWISLQRTHDKNNYKTRATVSQFILRAGGLRRTALAEFNRIREERFGEVLTLEQCQRRGILGREYFEAHQHEHARYKHYDALQVMARASEEIEYTAVEIQSALLYATNKVLELQRHQSVANEDNSILHMHTDNLRKSREMLATWLEDLAEVIHIQGISIDDVRDGLADIVTSQTQEEPPPGEDPIINEEDEDWEQGIDYDPDVEAVETGDNFAE